MASNMTAEEVAAWESMARDGLLGVLLNGYGNQALYERVLRWRAARLARQQNGGAK